MNHRSLACAVALLLVSSRGAVAQADSTRHEDKKLFQRRDLIVGGSFAALTIAMIPLDRHLALRLQDSTTQANRFLKTGTRRVQYFGDPGSVILSAGLYAIGRATGWRSGADIGLHSFEAVVLSGAITGGLKAITGRARPSASGGKDPDYFSFFGGISNNRFQSFPSGHTTAAFAVASAVTSESRRWSPRATWIVAPAMYGTATLVGLSRMYNNAHWASDVVLGAGIGTFSGLKVVRYSHAHPDNRLDRALLGLHVAPGPAHGITVGWSASR